jgi:ABC-type polysaccharide/polyol phosphate export permease
MSGFIYRSSEQRRVLRLFRDLIRARELLRDLVSKDLRVRYRYAVMGFLWAVIEPLALMLVLTFIFDILLSTRLPEGAGATAGTETPYAVRLLCGLIFWQFTASSITSATQSLIDNQNLVKKVNFTREVIPIAATGYPLVNLAIGFVLLLTVHLLLGGGLGIGLLWLPFIFGIHYAIVLGFALLLSCGNVHYRDVGYITGVAMVFGFYASPVFYELSFVLNPASVPEWAEPWYPWMVKLYLLNPMAGLLTAYRQVIVLGESSPTLWLLVWPSILGVLALLAGVWTFRRVAPTLSDHL